MTTLFQCLPTAIGSFPHRQPARICETILSVLREIPVWPQLPNLGCRESMYTQFSEGLPALILDEEKDRIFFNTTGDLIQSLESFYERFLAEDIDHFNLGRDYAAGFYAFKELMQGRNSQSVQYVKGQVTGPISFGLTVTDERKRSILYNEELFDAVVKGCTMKARWQIKHLKDIHPRVIIFIDEPYLSSFGSAFINLTRGQAVACLNEVIGAIQGDNAVAGVHCCGNTDWSLLMETDVDIINFDAYTYFQGITLYPEYLKRFFDRNGTLAWGIVPTSEAVQTETVETLVRRIEDDLVLLVQKGFPKSQLLENCLITPSCGTGSMAEDLADKTLRLTREVSNSLRRKYF